MEKEFFTPEPMIFAHRGDPINYPENTIPSFKSASESGVDVIETDLRITSDGHFVLFHDTTIDRMTNGRGKLSDYTLDDLKRFDAGYRFSSDGVSYPFRNKGITIPDLEECLLEFPEQRFNIDLKVKNPSQVKKYCEILKKHDSVKRVLTASEHTENLKEARKILPEMATSASRREVIGAYFLFKSKLLSMKSSFAADAFQIPEFFGTSRIVTREIIRALHRRNVRVHVWTVNRREDILRLLDYGVDGIITDDFRLLKEIIVS
ncbi:MAG TPA: glycerophosphodiester phosphodiesterase [Smithellaceae bacterium]|nr:glycerophosphodiester phosphodiesterase [Smithellaceae bacterium]HRS88676.1 glycerophosphodiester phosphodiesterase [Smithellaceae bacterium]HRV27092.1 glycerophosphodiester phosphodiesterase [Smithellaceae bacterium]